MLRELFLGPTTYNENTAKLAVKMGALPIFIMGLAILFTAANYFYNSLVSGYLLLILCCVAMIFIWLSFRIRAGNYASYIFLIPLFLVYMILSAGLALISNIINMPFSLAMFNLITGAVIPLILLSLSIRGYRGWKWLKQNQIKH